MEDDKKLDDTQDCYTPDVGTVEGPVCCGVCGTVMEESRNCYGPRGWVMAMSGSKSHYDSFTCPHRTEDWHRQVVKLRSAARDTASGRLEALYREEALQIVATRTPTKSRVSFF